MASHLAWSKSQCSSTTLRSYVTYFPQLVLWPHFLSFSSILFTPATPAASRLLKHEGKLHLRTLHLLFSLVAFSQVSPGWLLHFLQVFIKIHTQVSASLAVCVYAQSGLTVCDPMDCSPPGSMPGLPVHHQLPEFTQTRVHRVRDAIQPSHPRSSPSPPAPNPSQHQSLFQWVNSSQEVAKVLEFQL